MRGISLTDAKNHFLEMFEEVGRGRGFVITRRGRPIAMLVPHAIEKTDDKEWMAAYRRMIDRLETGASLKGLRVNRQELYPL